MVLNILACAIMITISIIAVIVALASDALIELIGMSLLMYIGTRLFTYIREQVMWYKRTADANNKKVLKEMRIVSKEVCEPDSSAEESQTKVRRNKPVPYATRVALEARAQVGLLKPGTANTLVYQRICRDIMKEHGVRPTHMALLLPTAVAACFMPSDEDIVASHMIAGSKQTSRRSKLAAVSNA
jgi:hypothetical protein